MPDQLAQHLIARGLLPPDRVEEALRSHAIAGGSFDTALLEQGLIAEAGMLQALGDVSGHRPVNLSDFEPNPEVAGFIPGKVAERMGLVPLSVDGTVLHVASVYPVPRKELQEIGFLLNKQLEVWVGLEVRIRDWVSIVYKAPLAPRYASLLAYLDPTRPAEALLPVPASAVAPPPAAPAQLQTTYVVEELSEAPDVSPILLDVKKKPAAAALAPETSPPTVAAPVVAVPSAPSVAVLPPPPKEPAPLPPGAPHWTLDEAKAALRAASREREAIIDVTLQYARKTFEYTAAFAVVQGNAVGWTVRAENVDPLAASQVSIPLDTPSLFRTVSMSRANFVGPAPQDPITLQLLEHLGRTPRTVFIYPIEVKARLVALIYGDNGGKPISQRRLADYLIFCQELAPAFSELILNRKTRGSSAADSARVAEATKRPPVLSLTPKTATRPATPTLAGASLNAGYGWSAGSSEGTAGRGRAAALSGPLFDTARAPTDFVPMLRKLTGPDATARARAIAELSQTPQASAKFLAEHFPGPTGWAKRPVDELPDPRDLGPIPAALSRLGRPAADALAPLLRHVDAQTRYLAALTAGSLPFPELLEGLFQVLFDKDPDVASAARMSVPSFKRLSRYDSMLQMLRTELSSNDIDRTAWAVQSLGFLRDRESVEPLIRLCASSNPLVADTAVEALRHITKADIAKDAPAWKEWWKKHQSEDRLVWLVQGLRSGSVQLRTAALDELYRAFNETLGFDPAASASARDPAVKRWESFVSEALQRAPATPLAD